MGHKGKKNAALFWTKIGNPVKIAYNYIIITFCKYLLSIRLKPFVLRLFLGMEIGKNVSISPETFIDPFYPRLITIEDNVIIGWKVNLVCHEFTERHIRLGRITIGENSLVGAFSTIRSGVKIGKNSSIAMNSFVNKNVPDFELWGGVPAKKIRKLKRLL